MKPGSGIKDALIGTTKRSSSAAAPVEMMYNKWPLYLWVGDSTPGQATGQGLNNSGGLWYVLSPTGKVITKRP